MKPVEMQPQVFQQPNLVGNAQQQASGATVAQAAFAEQLRRLGEARPAQVQAPMPGDASRPAENPGEDRGEKRRRRRAAPRTSPAGPAGRDPEPPAAPPPGGSRVDVRV